jgi:hypothetical protein
MHSLETLDEEIENAATSADPCCFFACLYRFFLPTSRRRLNLSKMQLLLHIV